MTAQPLAGLTVLDLSRLLPGAYCSVMLADMGCRVIKVEEPGKGDYYRSMIPAAFAEVNRNKSSITLNLKAAAGREVFLHMVRKADVVLESFRPGVTRRLGVDYDQVAALNPRIVYCSITGYGQDGPYRDLPGHDLNYMAVAGSLTLMGDPEGEPAYPTSVAIADFSSGMFAAIAISSGLAGRGQSGKGSYLDVGMTDGMASWMGRYAAEYQWRGAPTKKEMMLRPGYGVFPTADGKHIALGAIEDLFWQKLLRFLPPGSVPAGSELWSFEERWERSGEVIVALRKVFQTRTQAEWLDLLVKNDIPISPVNDVPAMLQDPHLVDRGLFARVTDPVHGDWTTVLNPIKVNGERPGMHRPAPALGGDTDLILKEFGYSLTDIDRLRSEGAI